ncbi:MAG TPA: ATP-grasp domain-containing protein, partial [Lachnospiraceae bacterium]
MKRILILGSLEEFIELVKMAKQRGHYVLVCDKNENGPAKEWADKSYHIDVREIEKIASLCKEEKIDTILTAFSDLLLECMVKIADRAGIKTYLTPGQLSWYRDKREMKKMFSKLGISSPKSVVLESDFIEESLKNLQFPIVIKPVDMYGSRGIFVLDEPGQVREVFEEACKSSGIKSVLAEEYHDGYEFNVTAWVMSGELYILSIADREKTQVVRGQIPINSRNVYPSCFTRQVYE